ncbi:hypothetical protein [Alkalicoccobacillus plakortidis]|uniref:Uncharacterized protein n=1 Tax=Alkalicoccobacillus plakortidis TaxID=444060 RepID=A0ABT0XDU3_9BACI|nr:hypothetical protein [Alkalicoccobacillus plakortidis]MCM2674072.1 hypothetical protein [Alkalicoccobacillus plakortidis]
MSVSYEVKINGFHGTIDYYSKRILLTKEFTYQYRDNHWLGQGIYFYRDDYDQAYWWSGKTRDLERKRRKIKGKALRRKVIKCDFTLMSENMINLDTDTGKRIFKSEQSRVHEGITFKISDHADASNKYRCALIDLFDNKFKVIQYTFIETREKKANKDSLFKELGIVQNGVQICVRDPEVLKGADIQLIEHKRTVNYGTLTKQTEQGKFEVKEVKHQSKEKRKKFHYGSEN